MKELAHLFAVKIKKFITGKGRYTDDINRAGQLYTYFVRSDRAMQKLPHRYSSCIRRRVLLRYIPEKMWQLTELAGQSVAG